MLCKISFYKNYYNLEPYLDTISWDHCTAETEIEYIFLHPKSHVHRNKQTVT